MKTILLTAIAASLQCAAQMPARKAFVGIQARPGKTGMVADSIVPGSIFYLMGLQKGDEITQVNGRVTATTAAWGGALTPLRTGDPVKVQYLRNGTLRSGEVKAVMRPFEKPDYADIQYDWVPFRGGWLRAITRKPKGAVKTPCILLIPGYGCGSIENYMSSYNGQLIKAWLAAGYAVVTVEKSGLGDSYGCQPCADADLVTDIESFDAGYRYMEQLPFADTSRLVIWGHSMGGVVAPEVARRHHPAAVMVFGATFRPWLEFLPEMHRVQKPLMENMSGMQTEAFVRTITKVYYEFFVQKKSPEQLRQNPEYTALVDSELGYKPGSNDMWGRHWRFWQQIDSLNLSQSWEEVNCPVLVLHGEADYEQCSRAEPLLMCQTINGRRPGAATLVNIPELDHFMMKSRDWPAAYENFKKQEYLKGNFNPAIAGATTTWLQLVLKKNG